MLRAHHDPGYALLVIAGGICRLEEIGGNRSRIDRRYSDSALAELLAQGIREAQHGMLGRRVGNRPGCADFAGH
ncbi:hypothetical protein D3C80_1899850 [compost metagenome]